MSSSELTEAIRAVNWDHNVEQFLKDASTVDSIAKDNLRLAVWSNQLENADKNSPALCFVRELQIASHHVAALSALALYKPAAASMRAILEAALYYSYFRTTYQN